MGKGEEMTSPTLAKADACINGERQDTYGNPEDSFTLIADYWNTYLVNTKVDIDATPLDSSDVAIMMTLFKIARMGGQKWHADNAVDACGYLAILNDRLKEGQ